MSTSQRSHASFSSVNHRCLKLLLCNAEPCFLPTGSWACHIWWYTRYVLNGLRIFLFFCMHDVCSCCLFTMKKLVCNCMIPLLSLSTLLCYLSSLISLLFRGDWKETHRLQKRLQNLEHAHLLSGLKKYVCVYLHISLFHKSSCGVFMYMLFCTAYIGSLYSPGRSGSSLPTEEQSGHIC